MCPNQVHYFCLLCNLINYMILGDTPTPPLDSFLFFWPVHLSYTRINFFLIDYRTMSFVADSRYHSITISDHCPVQLDMSFPNSSVPQRSWQLDPLLLKQPSFEKCISDQIDFFLLTNSTPGMSYGNHLRHISGVRLSPTHKKRECNKRLMELNQQILTIDNQLAHNSTPELFKERLLLQTEFDNLSIRQTERMMLKTR